MNTTLKKITFAAVFAALITVLTLFPKIPIGLFGGYIHLGDSLIYIAACLLGPYAAVAATIGGVLADVFSGFPIWAPATAVIKALISAPLILAAVFYAKNHGSNKIINPLTILATILSGLITVFGYYFAEGLYISDFKAALAGIPFNAIQAVGSAVVFIIFGIALDKLHFKERLM